MRRQRHAADRLTERTHDRLGEDDPSALASETGTDFLFIGREPQLCEWFVYM